MSTVKGMAWCAWFVASIFYAYQYILRVIPNIMSQDIMQQFNIDAAIFGQFSGAYYIGYCLMHLPVGIMLDRYGPKKVMSACILISVIGLLPIIMADQWIYPIIGRFFVGVGSSAAILGAFKIIRMTFAEKHFTRMLSFSVTIGLIGAIYGGYPVGYMVEEYGYKYVVEMMALTGIAFAAITYFVVPNMKGEHTTSIMADIKTVFSNKRVLMVCFLAGLMVGPMEGFADAWGSDFFKNVYGYDGNASNYLTSLIYVGMLFAPVLSRIAEYIGRYYVTIALAGSLMLAVFVLMILGNAGYNVMAAGLFVVGICCAYQILAIYKASTYVPESVAGLTTAVANMIIMSFGYVFHSVIGVIIKLYAESGNAEAFTYGIAIVPATLLVGALGFTILSFREKKQ